MIENIKKTIRTAQYKFNDLVNSDDVIRIHWYGGDYNFGDILNPILIEKLTNKKVLNILSYCYEKEHLFVIGSIIEESRENSIIWGSGFIKESSVLNEKPKKVYAVRGPKTRQKLLDHGIDCPEVYGDPALLMPLIYDPKKPEKKYKIGIIPHIVDREHPWIKKYENDDDILVIDLQNKKPLDVIDQIVSCERVISSSLHGLIVSDAYKIPSLWIRFSDKVTGGYFKFMDYFLSVNRDDKKPILIEEKLDLKDVISNFKPYEISIDLQKLLNSFPYKNMIELNEHIIRK